MEKSSFSLGYSTFFIVTHLLSSTSKKLFDETLIYPLIIWVKWRGLFTHRFRSAVKLFDQPP